MKIQKHNKEVAAIPMLVSRQQFLEITGIPDRSFREAEYRGDIPKHHKQLGARRYWKRRDVLDFIGEA